MGSIGAPQPWPLSTSKTPSSPPPSSSANNYNLRDCSQGICTLYCPQWCNPPPYLDPTVINNINNEDDDSSSTLISPLMVALISILASAFLLLSYYIIVFKYCKRRRQNRRNQDSDEEMRLDQLISDSTAASTTAAAAAAGGLDESFVRSITVFKYNKEDGLIEATDCAVCLNEFNEEESLRLMPNCQHAFHIPCIDAWLKTHSSCPLCRAGMIDGGNSNNSAAAAAAGNGNRQQGSGISSSGSVRPNNNQSVSAMQFQSRVRDVTVVLVGDSENRGRESTVHLELPASPGNFGRRREGVGGLGSQPQQQPTPPRQRQQQQQCRVTNEGRKEEIQR